MYKKLKKIAMHVLIFNCICATFLGAKLAMYNVENVMCELMKENQNTSKGLQMLCQYFISMIIILNLLIDVPILELNFLTIGNLVTTKNYLIDQAKSLPKLVDCRYLLSFPITHLPAPGILFSGEMY